jgi:epoxide hydrolase
MSSTVGTAPEIKPFHVEIPEEQIDDLRRRIGTMRWPTKELVPDRSQGVQLATMQELAAYWMNDYDFGRLEARLNALPQFTTEIDGVEIHFIHVRSRHADALPLVITHGWPGSVSEFLDIIDPLCNPRAHGGDPKDAFHVVAPSMPGYGWSGPTRDSGWDVRRIAEAWKVLMARLGYERYGAQGGDWGSMVSSQIGTLDAEHCAGVHINMVIGAPAEGAELSDEEQADLARMGEFMNNGTAYQQIQGKNPQTLGQGLNDSPAGLASWIVEKFHAWTDHDGDLETAVTRDQILTNLTVYWVTGTINSSVRLYCESQRSGRFPPFDKVEVPVGCALFPREILKMPRSWADQMYNVTRWTRFDRGGHFAALEEPDLLVDDVRAFFRTVR